MRLFSRTRKQETKPDERHPHLPLDESVSIGGLGDTTLRDVRYHATRISTGVERHTTPAEVGLAITVLYLMDRLEASETARNA